MARLKTARSGPNQSFLDHFRARAQAGIDRFEAATFSELATAELLYPHREEHRLAAIAAGEPFEIGAWELPPDAVVQRYRANNYTFHPNGRLEPLGEEVSDG